MVAPYEEHEAARTALIPWHEWRLLPPSERASCVAFHRMQRLVEAHTQDAIDREAERRQRRAQMNRGRSG